MAFLAGGVGIGGVAYAQETEAPPAPAEPAAAETAVDLDSLTVTGTRIKSQSLTASSPVMEISGEEFAFSGATLVEDLVNQYPQLSPVFDNFQNNPSLGYAEVDLRGLGANRTLTLLNGRRLPKGIGETPDISIIPSALVSKVDILTGGASAVYGSDAVAGVVNFILDTEFEGVSVSGGWSGYQHDNDNEYIQGLMDARGYDYPTGDSGVNGISRNLDLVIGGKFGDAGHATAWATYRKNAPLMQGQRDYSSCALNATGTSCGGSATADPGNFYIVSPASGFYGYALPSESGTWAASDPNLYNFAPINYYQRPDTRYTAGVTLAYELNEYAKPYIEAMYVNRNSTVQIAPSGAFFTDITVDCDFEHMGTLCADLGISDAPVIDEDGETVWPGGVLIYVAKRNVEGGPRINYSESNNFLVTNGIGGKIWDSWSYDASISYGRASTNITGINDFLTDRIRTALLDGSYDVWTDSVTPEQAAALQGTSFQNAVTSTQTVSGYVTGNLGFGLPWAGGEQVGLVAGYENRKETFSFNADTNLADGNFSGSGSQNPPLDEGIRVEDLFFESNIPIIADLGILSHLDFELGYRHSEYSTSGGTESFKIGFGANFLNDKYRVRGGFNRAIRAAGLNELYLPQQLGLWGGADPCAGADPLYTEEQCALTGVPDGRYGLVPVNPAAQYNQISGGTTELKPEEADTWTFGFAANPIKGLELSLDYFEIELTDSIDTVGARTIIDLCAVNADQAMCGLIHREPTSGALHRNDEAYVVNILGNFGGVNLSGLDFTGVYGMRLGPGKLTTTFVGTYVIEKEYSPVPGDPSANYDCAGVISPECQTQKYRHVASLRYSFLDHYTAGLRWRYFGALDYENPNDGSPLNADRLTCSFENTPLPTATNPNPVPCGGSQEIKAYSYIDLSGSVAFGPATWTFGVNNVADKEPPMVGSTLTLNGNSVGQYDQAGRYVFTSIELQF